MLITVVSPSPHIYRVMCLHESNSEESDVPRFLSVVPWAQYAVLFTLRHIRTRENVLQAKRKLMERMFGAL